MGLLKRPKKPRAEPPLPGRQVICGECGTSLFTDDYPGGPIPPYCCLNCKSCWPPTEEEESVRRKAKREAEVRALQKNQDIKQHLECGGPVVWLPKTQLTQAQKKAMRINVRSEEIFAKPAELLSKREWKWLDQVTKLVIRDHRRGRRKNPQYDEWLAIQARARLSGGRRPFLRDLAGRQLPQTNDSDQPTSFKDEMDRLRDAFKKARKRRQLPAPPMR